MTGSQGRSAAIKLFVDKRRFNCTWLREGYVHTLRNLHSAILKCAFVKKTDLQPTDHDRISALIGGRRCSQSISNNGLLRIVALQIFAYESEDLFRRSASSISLLQDKAEPVGTSFTSNSFPSRTFNSLQLFWSKQ